MKKIQNVEKLKAYEICSEIANGKSLLLTLGGWKQFLLIMPLRLLVRICYFFLLGGIYHLPKSQQYVAGRKKLARILHRIAPCKMQNQFSPHYINPLVIGFNHCSTGDILRLVTKVLEYYPAKPLYFPVKLSFYEALAPIVQRLEILSIFLYPLITPNMMKSLKVKDNFALIERLKMKLNRNYLNAARMCCDEYGALVVAPSATRKRTVFDSAAQAAGELNESLTPTMSLLLKSLQKNRKVIYMAVSLIPPNIKSRGLNLFKVYRVRVAREFSTELAEMLDEKSKRGFEYAFLKALTNNLPYEMWHPPKTKDYVSAP